MSGERNVNPDTISYKKEAGSGQEEWNKLVTALRGGPPSEEESERSEIMRRLQQEAYQEVQNFHQDMVRAALGVNSARSV